MKAPRLGVLGATSFVGDSLLPQVQKAYTAMPFSRRMPPVAGEGIALRSIPYWISLVPIWALPEYFDTLLVHGAKRVIALSSTSVFIKMTSRDLTEQQLAARLEEAEQRLMAWAKGNQIDVVILRPTLIYGRGRDRNVSEIARFIHRFGFFPIFGEAKGLRQPIHVDDVASACVSAIAAKHLNGRSYNISGGETLTYREMVRRIFEALGKRPRLITFPLWAFSIAVAALRIAPRFRHWSVTMAERMNQDMVFDHTTAQRDLNLSLRPFRPERADIISG